jgi:hypothetical protein
LLERTVCEHAARIVEAIRTRNEKVIGHGRTTSEGEADHHAGDDRRPIRATTDTIAEHRGRRAHRRMGPRIPKSAFTADLLKEEGHRRTTQWPCDDEPVSLARRAGPLLSIPCPGEINNAPAILNRGRPAEESLSS